MSRNLKVFILATFVCYAVGAMNDAPVMYVLSGVCVVIILICFLLSRLALSRVHCELVVPGGRTSAGRFLHARVRVGSRGMVTVPSARVEVSAKNLTIPGVEAKQRVLLPVLRPGAHVTTSIQLECPARGRYLVGPVTLLDSDPIGVFDSRRIWAGAKQVVAFPRTLDLPRIITWEVGLGRPGGSYERACRERGDFFGIRQHTPGDDLRHVHWKVTAHAGELVVKEYEPILHDMVTIHLDLRATNHYGEGIDSTLETAVSAAASLARAALGEQRFVALVGDGLPASVSTPGVGVPHLQRIILALAEVKAEATHSFTQTFADQLSEARPGGSIFIITTAAEEGLAEVVVSAVRRGATARVLVVEGEMAKAPARFADVPPRLIARLRAAQIGVARLRTPAEIGEALLATQPMLYRRAVGAI